MKLNQLYKVITLTAAATLFSVALCYSQEITFKGQLSGWSGYYSKAQLPLGVGSRYLPQLNGEFKLYRSTPEIYSPKERSPFADPRAEFEIAANLYGNGMIDPFTYSRWSGGARLYRGWLKIATDRAELRVGLQKINFGSATLLRPLMWFDKVDARDPLQFTDGVWGALGRYYLRDNSNIWLWVLYGNREGGPLDISDAGGVTSKRPEYGGRAQLSIPKGEAALTYHRKTEENRFAFDIKLDVTIGLWAEASWINKRADLGVLTNQTLINIGADYTFGVGNGLNLIAEHLTLSYDKRPFDFSNIVKISALSASYPLGMNDNISYILYCDWKNGELYNFVNWRHNFRDLTLYIMGYLNSGNTPISLMGNSNSLYTGSGVQIMLVYNHQTKKILNKLIK